MAEREVEFKRALDTLARLLALRDHSVYELKQKLGRRFDEAVVTDVIDEARERDWLASEAQIAERLVEALSRRGKSAAYIRAQLRKRRLPETDVHSEDELEKARTLLVKKFGSEKLSFEDRARAFRFLKYRGFEDHWIRKALDHEQP